MAGRQNYIDSHEGEKTKIGGKGRSSNLRRPKYTRLMVQKEASCTCTRASGSVPPFPTHSAMAAEQWATISDFERKFKLSKIVKVTKRRSYKG